jgi:hypothetical protein
VIRVRVAEVKPQPECGPTAEEKLEHSLILSVLALGSAFGEKMGDGACFDDTNQYSSLTICAVWDLYWMTSQLSH